MAARAPKVRDDLEYFEQVIDGEDMILVRDPVRASYFRFNLLQAAMLRALDGHSTAEQITAQLSEQYEVEIPPVAAERFITKARDMMLLDISSYSLTPEVARKHVRKALLKSGFRARISSPDGPPRALTAESIRFAEAFRQLDLGHPRAAAGYLAEILAANPNNTRAKELYDIIQTAYIRASGGLTDFPTWVMFNPSRLLTWLSRTMGGFLFSSLGVLAMLAFLCVGIYAYTLVPFEEVRSAGPFDVAVAVGFYLVGGIFHEMGHGLACQHYGGNVTEIGFTFFYYIKPAAYCDTSSSYQFTERRPKVIIQLGGIVATLMLIAATLIFLAVMSPTIPIYRGLAIEVLIEMAVVFLALIPFMKMDGYYAICDYFNFANMRERSFNLTREWLSENLLGIGTPTEELPRRIRTILIIYGIASFLFTTWFIYMAYFKLLTPLVEWMRTAGLVFALALSAYMLRNLTFKPLARLAATIVRERRRVFTRRRAIVWLALSVILIGPWLIQRRVVIDGSFDLVPHERISVRAQIGGRVAEVLVAEGQRVVRGQPLAMLRNATLHARLDTLVAKREVAVLRLDRLVNGATAEELALASRKRDHAMAAAQSTASRATLADQLAADALGTQSRADLAREHAAVATGAAVAAQSALSLVKAGSRPEDIAIARADLAVIDAELGRLRTDETLLTLRSPIDGVVVTPHLEDKLEATLAPGTLFAEIHDVSSMIAEISLSQQDPLAEIAVGNEIALRTVIDPDTEILVHVDHFRQSTQGDTDERTIVIVTSPFTPPHPVSGAVGHARIYGATRSLAYAKLYLPLQRLIRLELWSI